MGKQNQSFSIIERFRSFRHALNGIKILITEEHNARIHLVVALVVVLLSFYFKISAIEWLFVLFSIGLVVVLEVINTVVENIADFISPETNESIKKIKDLSAAAVFIGSLTAVLVGCIIFIPRIITLTIY
jgi:diacylglycerol kinase